MREGADVRSGAGRRTEPTARRDVADGDPRPHGADAALRLGVLDTKLVPPPLPPRAQMRSRLVERLLGAPPSRLVALVAPAGYGKTTLLRQWMTVDERPAAWVSVDRRDDAVGLARAMAASIVPDAIDDPELVGSLLHPGSSVWTSAMPRLGRAIAARSARIVIVDDADRLPDREAAEVVLTIADYLPEGSTLAFATRSEGWFQLARLVANGRARLLGPSDLAFTPEETTRFMDRAGRRPDPDGLRRLQDLTEGWPAAVGLLAVRLPSDGEPPETSGTPPTARPKAHATGEGTPALAPDRRTRRLVEAYIRDEIVPLAGGDADFVLATSMLDRLTPPLCDAVLERTDSAAILDRLARSDLILVPLDAEGRWYRHQRLIGEVLRAELERSDPEFAATLARRAAVWHEAVGLAELALEYAMAADDRERVGRLVLEIGQTQASLGRLGTVRGWLQWLDHHRPAESWPTCAALGTLVTATSGEVREAERWLLAARAAARPHETAFEGALRHLGEAFVALDGPERMLADAEAAADGIGEHPFRATALFCVAAALASMGETAGAAEAIDRGLAVWERLGVSHMATGVALALRADLHLDAGDREAADAVLRRARALVVRHGLDDDLAGVVISAASARLASARGVREQARRDAAHATLHRNATMGIPWAAVRVRLDLVRTDLALGQTTGARVLLAEVRDVMARRPIGSTLAAEVDELEARLSRLHAEQDEMPRLTGAELRVLPLLSTHLSFREIGDRLVVSQNTVKTQALSIYRKLNASSRSEAVGRAIELGLLESSIPGSRS